MRDRLKSVRRSSALAFAMMAMVLIVVMAVPAYAVDTTTWYVAKTGDDGNGTGEAWAPFLTIQHALGVAGDGDTIEVGTGTFAEDLVITTDNIELTRWGTASVTIQGVATDLWGIHPTATPNININADGVRIHDITIKSPAVADGSYSSGIVLAGTGIEIDHIQFESLGTGNGGNVVIQTWVSQSIDNLSIHDNTFTGTPGGGYSAIYINAGLGSDSVSIQDNTLTGKIYKGISCEQSHAVIHSNSLSTDWSLANTYSAQFQGTPTGLYIVNWHGDDQSDVTLDSNVIEGSGVGCGFIRGMHFGTGAGATLAGFVVTDNTLNSSNIQVLDDSGDLDMDAVFADNTFDKAVVVDHPGSSLLHTIWSTIQAAIDAAVGGDTVQVAAGTYTENVNVGISLTLQGASSATVTVTAADPASSVITVTASSVTISGFTVSGATGGGQAGIFLGAGVTLCNIHHNILTGSFDGIWLGAGSNHNTLANNTLSSNQAQGFELYHSDDNTLTDNIASTNTGYGFKMESASYNTLAGNTANSNTRNGFYLVVGPAPGSTGCNNNTFTGNTANSNTEYGIRINGGTGNTLTANTFDANVKAGIRLKEEVTTLTLDSNTISGSPIGIDIDTSVTDVTTWTVTDNCITGNTTFGVSNLGTGTLDARHNWWGSVSGPGVEGPGSGDKVSAGVTYTPWLNACDGEDVTLPTITVTLPEFVVQGVPELQEFTVVTDNPDTTWDPVGYSVKVDHTDALVVGDIVLEYYNGATWDAVTLAVVGGNLEGPFGPQDFSLGTGTRTDNLRARAGASAPAGTYTVTVSLKLTTGACETIQTGDDMMVVNPAPTITEGALPAFEVGGAYEEFTIQLVNPADGASYAHAVLNLRIQGPAGSDLTASMFRLQSQGSWNDVTLTEDGNDLVANFGGPGGFAMAPSYDQTTTFRMKAQLSAPAGAYNLVATLVYLDSEPEWTLGTRTDPFTVGGGTAAMSMDFDSGWNMISVPVVGADNVPETVFVDVITSGQPLVIYEWVSTGPSSGSYAIPTEVDAGRGYWLYLFQPVTINATGPLESGTYTVPLTTAGWHQISTPKWPVAWSAVQFTDGTDTCSLADAVTNGWLYPVAYSYNPDTKEYEAADIVDGAIDPWTGYWICARVPGLTMNIPMEVPYIPGPMSVHSMSVPAGLQPPAPPMVPMSADLLGIEFGNSPNPIRDVHTTTFYVQGRGADLVDAIRVQIFDQGGQLVYEATEEGASLDWHTDNDYGEYLANGVYLYRLYVRVNDAWIVSDVRKLAILR